MKIHANSAVTVAQRRLIKELYATGHHTQAGLAKQFGCTRKTVAKWVKRADPQDLSSAPKVARRRITPEFEAAVAAYRGDALTRHHGVVRIAFALKPTHACANPSNVHAVLTRLKLAQKRSPKAAENRPIPVGKHRTQMDVQQLPAVVGGSGFEYKISIIHLSTRAKYSEIHDNYRAKTIAQVYQNALERLPPFSSLSPTTPCVSP